MQQQPNGNDRLDRIERIIEGLAEKHDALASTAAEFFGRLAQQQEAHEARMREMQAKHEARMNDHEEVLLDHEDEHRRLLRAQVITADDLRETSAAHRRTEVALAEASEKLNGLIAVVDDFIRRQPRQ
jgi:chromosome segregation ATPase